MAKIGGFDPNKTGEQAVPGDHRSDARLEISRDVVSRAAPYLAMTDEGRIHQGEALRPKAAEISKVLYGIAPSVDRADYDRRVLPHHRFVDETVWKPILGKDLLTAVKGHFQNEGIHCHTPEVLDKESRHFAQAVASGDVSRLSNFLEWTLKEDPAVIEKIQALLG